MEKEPGSDRVQKLRTSKGVISLGHRDELVVAAGAWTPALLWSMDLFIPVYPMKGYSIAFEAPGSMGEKDLPQRIISDEYTYTSRLGSQVRVTSVGEFDGWNTRPDEAVDAAFREQAILHLPQLKSQIEGTATRCGHRPFVSDGIILVGRVPSVANLSINVGPGFNGWKVALGSGEVLVDALKGSHKGTMGFDGSQLSPLGRVRESPLLAKASLAHYYLWRE
ncbi:unnamed protein product [Chrysoparadoxa australica]